MTDSSAQLPVPAPAPRPRPVSPWPVWLALAIALVAVLALAVWSWQQWQSQQLLAERVSQLHDDRRQTEQREQQTLTETRERLRSMESRLQDQRDLLATQQRQIDHNARELLNAGFRNRTDWLLAESEYLLRVANQRLLIEKDVRGALAALQAADDVLRDTDDIGVYPVREQLAREILALRNISDIDRTGLYLQLEALRESVAGLTDDALIREETSGVTASEPQSSPDQGALQRGWQAFRQSLREIVVIRRMDTPVEPLMSPEQSAWARLNLQLMLEQAELAVLRGHSVLYRQSLGKALTALDAWYDQSDQRLHALRTGIEQLKARDIDPPLPDISQSLGLLKGRLEGRSQPDETASGGDNES